MAENPLDAQKRKEAQRRYDQLTARIAALDTDIGRSTDSEHKLTAQQARADLARERDAVAAEITAQDKRTNGDLEILQRKVSELGRVLASDHPQEAHAIINECAAALMRLDNRVLGLEGRVTTIEKTQETTEGRVTAIEQHIHPPIIVTALRIVALAVFLFAGTLFWIKDTREVLFGLFPWAGIATEGALILAVVAILLLANAQLEKAR